MEIIVRLFPYGKTIAGLRRVHRVHLLKDGQADTGQRAALRVASANGGRAGDSFLFAFQTQATQSVLEREGPFMPRVAMLLGVMGIGMSGYSSRQLTLHGKPSPRILG